MAASVSGIVHAQTADENAVSPGEIVVTAQKRSQPLSEVPASISAIGGEQLEQQRILTVSDLAGRVPSFQFTRLNLSDTHLTIRGIGSSPDGAALDRSVAIFVDDVYIGRAAAAASDIFDLERVEVLRGPQGTLYGKNVVGGAINYVTPTPTDEFRARIRAGVGNYGTREIAGVISGGLGGPWAASLSAQRRDRGGYATNLETGGDLDDERTFIARSSLAFNNGGDIRVRLTADYGRSSGHGAAWYPLFNGNGTTGITDALRVGITPRKLFMGRDGHQIVETYGVVGKVDWAVAGGSLTSITAYRGSNHDIMVENIGTNKPRLANGDVQAPQPIGNWNVFDERARQVSQELRYLWEDADWTILLGAFAMEEKVYKYKRSDLTSRGTLIRLNIDDGRTRSYAGFVDVTYRPLPGLEIDAGLRYTLDHRRFLLEHGGTGGQYGVFPIPAPGPFFAQRDNKWRAWTPKLSVRYELAPRLNAYAVVSRGFKSGGFDGQPTNVSGLAPIDPEFVWNYEAGLKGTVFNSRLYFDLSAFQMDYTDLQATLVTILTQVPLTTAVVLTNAAAARVRGIEASFKADLGSGFDVGGNLSHIDGLVTKTNTPARIAIGNRLPNAPKFSYAVNAGYTHNVASNYELAARVEYIHSGNQYQTVENLPQALKPSYSLINANLTLTHLDNGLEVSLWGKNLTDKEYVTYLNASGGLGGIASYGPPRTYGLSLAYRW